METNFNINSHTLYRLGTRFLIPKELGFEMPTQSDMYKLEEEKKNIIITQFNEILKYSKPFFLGTLGEYKKSDFLYLYSKKFHAIIIMALDTQTVISIFSPYAAPDRTEIYVDEIYEKVKWTKNDFFFNNNLVDIQKLKEIYSPFEDTALKVICKYMS